MSTYTVQERDEVNAIFAQEEKAQLYKERNKYFLQYQTYFQNQIKKQILGFDIDLVVYDETEYFRQHDHPLFNYPYTPRKNLLTSYKFNILFDEPEYTLFNQEIKLQKSVSCLEAHYMDQVNFIGDLASSIKDGIGKLANDIKGVNQTDTTSLQELANPDQAACGSTFFQRVKYSKHQGATMKFSDYYDTKLFSDNDDTILLQITLQQDSVKSTNFRSSTQILDFIGDVGGFQQAMLMLFYIIGEYFSAKYLLKSIAEVLYLQKVEDNKNIKVSKSNKTFQGEGGTEEQTLEKMFKNIKINSFYMLCDPVLKCLCPCSKTLKT